MNKAIIYTDGGSRGNPGPSAIGVVICNDKDQAVKKYSEYIDEATNNEAEYQAVIFGLKKVKLLYGKKEAAQMAIEIKADSELVVKQLSHQYKVKEEHIQKLFMQVWNLMMNFKKVDFTHIEREKNKEADELVNEALDNQSKASSLPGF